MATALAGTVLETVCPRCHGGLVRGRGGLSCARCPAQFPRRVPADVFLDDEEWQACLAHLRQEEAALRKYTQARRRSPLNVRYYDYWVARLLGEVPPHCLDHLVELMCGEAEVCRRLPPACRAALALDYNPEMVVSAGRDLERAGERRVRVVCGTAARLPLADGSVGAVVIQGGLHHARPLLAQVLAEIRRVLRPGGVLAASEPANDHWLTRRVRRWQYERSALQGNDPDEDGFTRAELASALAAHGLRLERYRVFGYVAYPLMGNTDLLPLLGRVRAPLVGRALLALDAALEWAPLVRRMGWASLFRATKE
jgi:SAM-dependent methyltransferase